ncbi:hypothetical protein MAR_028013 [Mya arenaria]|uniref:Uncharacterized protein n=1 Tax=Mya arenaria TaxID=6604 RepID=A0ABY7DGX0_MYAAR|nr:hypothetical protein MAR_028013 [Mya arenaria]
MFRHRRCAKLGSIENCPLANAWAFLETNHEEEQQDLREYIKTCKKNIRNGEVIEADIRQHIQAIEAIRTGVSVKLTEHREEICLRKTKENVESQPSPKDSSEEKTPKSSIPPPVVEATTQLTAPPAASTNHPMTDLQTAMVFQQPTSPPTFASIPQVRAPPAVMTAPPSVMPLRHTTLLPTIMPTLPPAASTIPQMTALLLLQYLYEFRGISETPIFQTFSQANMQAISNDHDYFELSHEDNFLKLSKLTKLSEKDRDDIEMYTRGQNKNDRWFEEGKKIIQSSHFHCVCTATERTDLNDLANSFVRGKV